MWILVLLACVPCEGELLVTDGDTPVPAGGSLTLEYRYRDEIVAGPDACGAYWEVDGVEGGDDEVGTVTTCGVYVAPAEPPDEDPEILVASDAPGTCADCCPHARLTIPIER